MNKLSYKRKSRLLEKLAGLSKGITSRLHPRVQQRARAGIVPQERELVNLPPELRQRVIAHFAGRNAGRLMGLGRRVRKLDGRHRPGRDWRLWDIGRHASWELGRGRRVAAAKNPSDEFLMKHHRM